MLMGQRQAETKASSLRQHVTDAGREVEVVLNFIHVDEDRVALTRRHRHPEERGAAGRIGGGAAALRYRALLDQLATKLRLREGNLVVNRCQLADNKLSSRNYCLHLSRDKFSKCRTARVLLGGGHTWNQYQRHCYSGD